MASKAPKPFPIQMEVEFLDRLSEPVRDGKARSVSDLIRTALGRYDFSDVLVMHPAQLTISVRLPTELRRQLKKTARAKHTSVGHLVRAAVEAYLPELENQAAGQLEMAMPAPEPLAPGASASAPRRSKPRKHKAKKRAAKKKRKR
jgi:Arc/MetJ-type ribon-helix-helix transcriptional regulator